METFRIERMFEIVNVYIFFGANSICFLYDTSKEIFARRAVHLRNYKTQALTMNINHVYELKTI